MNLIELYIPVCDTWSILNNMVFQPELIAEGSNKLGEIVYNYDIWERILKNSYDCK